MKRAIGVGAALLAVIAGVPATAGAADELRPRQWNMTMIRADEARSTSTGSGATVAIIDSGVQADHPDLNGRLLPGRDYVDDDSTPQDGDGHGTHVTGIIGASTDNGVGIASVAPRAKLLPLRVLDDEGGGDESDIVEAIDFAVAQGADVINLSLGFDVPITAIDEGSFGAALDRALDRGVIVVAAAGNNGLPICEQPSGQGRLLCVGAVDKRGNRSFFSSFGAGLRIVAPGGSGIPLRDEGILSTVPPSDYAEFDGTSQAAPHVSGVAALLVSLGVRGQDAVNVILATARDVGSQGPDPEYGAGIVDAAAVVARARRPAAGGGGSGGGGTGGPGGDGGSGGGGGTQGGGGATGSSARISIRRVQRISTVLKKGIALKCRASGAGRCAARATYRGKTIARGSASLRAGRTSTVRARLTRDGSALVRRARKLKVSVGVTAPGIAPRTYPVTLTR